MTHPRGTAYLKNLYALDGWPDEVAQIVEEKFFGATDKFGSDALKTLLNKEISDISADDRSGWSRFVLSLVHRNPENISWLRTEIKHRLAAGWQEARKTDTRWQEVKATYENFRQPSDPETIEEYMVNSRESSESRAFAELLQSIVDSQNVGAYLNGMRWSVLTITSPEHTLLTSDRPVVMSDGVKHDHSYIIVPLGPDSLFLAVNTAEREQEIRKIPITKFIRNMNDIICKQAGKFVYGTDSRQLRFVSNRLGRGVPQFIASKGTTSNPRLS